MIDRFIAPGARKRLARALVVVYALIGVPGPRPSRAQAQEGTDIWVFRLSDGGSALDVASGVRATDRPGYDNQPSFLPGGRFLLFTSIDEAGQADIRRFDLERGTVEGLIQTTPESEYSATLMPSGDRISVIRVEADSTQRLWSFDMSGESPELVLTDIRPVGYHAWLDQDRLALFVLGSPATLQVASVSSGLGRILARNIGRSIHEAPSGRGISFVQWSETGEGAIWEMDPSTGEAWTVAPLLEGNEFFAWTPEGVLLMGQGSKLFRWIPGSPGVWEEFADLGPAGVTGISRIAVSPEGDRIAVVGLGV